MNIADIKVLLSNPDHIIRSQYITYIYAAYLNSTISSYVVATRWASGSLGLTGITQKTRRGVECYRRYRSTRLRSLSTARRFAVAQLPRAAHSRMIQVGLDSSHSNSLLCSALRLPAARDSNSTRRNSILAVR